MKFDIAEMLSFYLYSGLNSKKNAKIGVYRDEIQHFEENSSFYLYSGLSKFITLLALRLP